MSWSDCSHIALASSFGASLLAGKRVPIDHSDAAGMNLMDLSTRRWSEKLVNFVGGDLSRVLPEPIPAWTKCGHQEMLPVFPRALYRFFQAVFQSQVDELSSSFSNQIIFW